MDGEKQDKEIVEQEVYLGELPLITDKGTFVINGAERVIVSQLHRSPGVFFDETIHANGKKLFSARIIPYRGSWVEFTVDINDVMHVNIDRRRKLPVTILLKAMGFDQNQAILRLLHQHEDVKITVRPGKRDEETVGRISIADVLDKKSGEVIIEAGQPITQAHLDKLREAKIFKIACIKYAENQGPEDDVILKTIHKDNCPDQENALKKIYNLIRPGDPPNLETATALLTRMFFTPKRYDLAAVGRYKINRRLKLQVPEDETTLDQADFIAVIACLLDMKEADAFETAVGPRNWTREIKGVTFIGYDSKSEDWLAKAISDAGQNRIVVIAHSEIQPYHPPGEESYDRYAPKLHKQTSALLQEWCDELLFANYETYIRKVDQGFNRRRSIASGNGERVIHTSEKPAFLAKNRIGLPETLPLDFAAFAKHLKPRSVVASASEES